MSKATLLGYDTATGKPVEIGDRERLAGTYILGKPNMGKTNTLLRLALHDIEQGYGLFFLDPHGDAIKDIRMHGGLPRLRQAVVLDPEIERFAFGINLTSCENVGSLNARVNTYTKAYNVFKRAFAEDWGPWLQLIIENTLYTFIENQEYTLAEAPRFLLNAEFRERLVSNMRYNPEVIDFWQYRFSQRREREQEAQVDAALTRFSTFLGHPYIRDIIGQTRTTIDFARYMHERKIVFLRLSANLAEDIKRFIGTILISELLHAVRRREELPVAKRTHFSVFVDEFQHFATEDFADLITEGRKFGVATTIAHQERVGQLRENPKVLGATLACANKILFQLTVRDAQELAPEFARSVEETRGGYEAELILSPHALSDIWERGHPDPVVMEARRQWFWIVDLLKQNPQEKYFLFDPKRLMQPIIFKMADYHGWDYYRSSAEGIREAISLLDRFLYNRMSSTHYSQSLSSEELDLLIRVVPLLGGIFGFGYFLVPVLPETKLVILNRVFRDYWERERREQLIHLEIEMNNLKNNNRYNDARSYLFDGRRKLLSFQDVREKNWSARGVALEFQFKIANLERTIESLKLASAPRVPLPRTITSVTIKDLQEQALTWGLSSYEVDTLFEWEMDELSSEYIDVLEHVIREEFSGIHKEPSHNKDPRARWQTLQVCAFITCLSDITKRLLDHPIKIPSGKYDETMRVERTQQDLINEMALVLSELPPYTASAKVISLSEGTQHTSKNKVRTQKAPEGSLEVTISLSECYTSRTEVNRRIAQRLSTHERRPGSRPPPRSS